MQKDIKIMILDVDGTLTDGKVYLGPEGEICKAFSCKDGYGIDQQLVPSGIIPVILTGRNSEIVVRRGRELRVNEIHINVKDKDTKLKEILGDLQAEYSEVAYIGDDMNDFSCMQAVKDAGGLVGCPEDAAWQVREIADFIAPHRGGEGAVRDFIEWILGIAPENPSEI